MNKIYSLSYYIIRTPILILFLFTVGNANKTNTVISLISNDQSIHELKNYIISMGGDIRVVKSSGSIMCYIPPEVLTNIKDEYVVKAYSNSNNDQSATGNVENSFREIPHDFPVPVLNRTTERSDKITSSYMIGSCRVDVIIVESAGNSFDWSQAEISNAVNQLSEALVWWTDQAASRGTPLEFVVSDPPHIVTVPDEPINNSSGLFHLGTIPVPYLWSMELVDWMDDALSDLGYNTGNWDGIFNLVNDNRAGSETDWGFSIFLVDNANDNVIVQPTFADNISAYAMMWIDQLLGLERWHGGPTIVSTSDGLDSSQWKTYAHEIGHIFGAPDEYGPESIHCSSEWFPGTECEEKYGYLHIENGNCELCADPWDECIMTSYNWNENDPSSFFCDYTLKHIGWLDTDSDGPMDPVDGGHLTYSIIQNLDLGDKLAIYDEAVNHLVTYYITRMNSFYSNAYWNFIWDGSTTFSDVYWETGYFIYTINDVQQPLLFHPNVGTMYTPNILDFSESQLGVSFMLINEPAHVRCEAISQTTSERFFLIQDEIYTPGTHNINVNLSPDIYDVSIFAWKSNNQNSPTRTLVLDYSWQTFSGTLTENTTFPRNVIIDDNLTVANGVTLTINPQTTIKVNYNKKIQVYGRLNAIGSTTFPITFTRSGSTGKWYGIRFEDSSSDNSIISNCKIQNATYGVRLNRANPLISNNVFTNTSYGLYMYYSTPSPLEPKIISNEINGRVYLNKSNTYFDNNYINNGDIYLYRSSPKMFNNTIEGNGNLYLLNANYYSAPELGSRTDDTEGHNRFIHSDGDFTILSQNHSNPFLGSTLSCVYQRGGDNSFIPTAVSSLINALSYSLVEAEWSWWGDYPPNPFMFNSDGTSTIVYDNALTSDPGGGSSLYKSAVDQWPPPFDPNSALIIWAWAEFYLQEDNLGHAHGLYTMLLNRFPETRYAQFALSRIVNFIVNNGNSNAINHIINILNRGPNSTLRASILDVVANYYCEQNELENAQQYAEMIFDEFPYSEEEYTTLFNLFNLYLNDLDDVSNAQDILDTMIVKYPNYELTLLATSEMGEDVDWSQQTRFLPRNVLDEVSSNLPIHYQLEQNYPNPFNATTVIPLSTPEETIVSLAIYDLKGRLVKNLVNKRLNAGYHQILWDSSDNTGKIVATGMYFYQISTNDFTETKKMILMK